MPCVAIDLFCGIGGLTKGLSLAGIDVVAGVDIDESCRFAYEKNNNAIFLCEDVTNITGIELNELYPEKCVKILAGCAPCQPFRDIHVGIEKKDTLMISGNFYILLKD